MGYQVACFQLMRLAKSITGEEIAWQFITLLSPKLPITPNLVVAAMRDYASMTISVIIRSWMLVVFFSYPGPHGRKNENTYIIG